MSKLADAIRRTLRTESAPMGFGASRSQPKATMLVGLLVPAASASAASGADVLVIDGRKGTPSAADVRASGETLTGVWGRNVDRGAVAELRKAGADFLLFEADSTPAAALLDDDIGYVLALPGTPEETYLRSLGPLNLDAFFLEELPSPLTVARQLELTRIGVFGGKPVMARVKAEADASELECLRAAGVAVLLVEDAGGIAKLRETVLSLPARKVRKDERPSVAVSLPRAQAPAEDDDDDD